jgi:SAM-dependent methyltransferase
VRVSFDEQAGSYEERAGLPQEICREVASLVLASDAGIGGGDGLVLDVGAGTGGIGRELAQRARYVGIDVSRPMLRQFDAPRLQADADGHWPLADGSAAVILFSRSAHLLKSEAVLAEVLRVGAPGARVLVGRVKKPRESAPEQLKRTMQNMLRDLDVAGKNGERAARDFLEALLQRGATRLEDRFSAEWCEDEAPIDSLTSWRSKPGLAGRAVPDALKAQILDELLRWAEERLGDVHARLPVPRRYRLEGAQLAG